MISPLEAAILVYLYRFDVQFDEKCRASSHEGPMAFAVYTCDSPSTVTIVL